MEFSIWVGRFNTVEVVDCIQLSGSYILRWLPHLINHLCIWCKQPSVLNWNLSSLWDSLCLRATSKKRCYSHWIQFPIDFVLWVGDDITFQFSESICMMVSWLVWHLWDLLPQLIPSNISHSMFRTWSCDSARVRESIFNFHSDMLLGSPACLT